MSAAPGARAGAQAGAQASAGANGTLELRRPDDWHLHLRDGPMLEAVVGATARDFGRALVMPNLVPPVLTKDDAVAYRTRILRALARAAPEADFAPLMTLYLTERTDPADVIAAHADGTITAVKLYPAGATTNSASGVTDVARTMPVLEAMAAHGVPLCVHGEVTDPEVDIFDREAVFLDRTLLPLLDALPELSVTLEHVTTADGVAAVRSREANLFGSITPHHLMIDRNHLLVGGIRPHYYCLPIVKRARHREALVAAATSGDPRFFLGTDSAPHAARDKTSACGCAGVFNAATALGCAAEVFEAAGALDRLEGFCSVAGARRYGLEPAEARITLVRRESPAPVPGPTAVPGTAEGDEVVAFDPGAPVHWSATADANG